MKLCGHNKSNAEIILSKKKTSDSHHLVVKKQLTVELSCLIPNKYKSPGVTLCGHT